MSLFRINPEDSLVELNVEWISMIPEFRALLQRSKGPLNGRDRFNTRAVKEFTYIYLRYDFNSPYFKDTEEVKEYRAVSDSGVSEEILLSDEFIKDACRKYVEIQNSVSPAIRSYERLKEANQYKLNFLETIDLHATTEGGAKRHSMKEIDDTIKAQPSVLKALGEIYDLAKEELKGEVGLRGEATKGYDEDPDY